MVTYGPDRGRELSVMVLVHGLVRGVSRMSTCSHAVVVHDEIVFHSLCVLVVRGS